MASVFFNDYAVTDVVSSFMHYGSVKSRRRRLREYSDEQRAQLGEEFASSHKDMGQTWKIFGQLNWRYGQPAKKYMERGLENVETIRKDPAAKALSLKYADDYKFLEAIYVSPDFQQLEALFESVNGVVWWIHALVPIILTSFVFKSWTLTFAMILNGIWTSEAFHYAAKWEGTEVCGQSIMTFGWKGMWIALSGIWWKLKFRNFFSWGLPAIIAFFQFTEAISQIVTTQLSDPTNFSEHNRKKWTTTFNGKLISHTGHLYGLLSGMSMAWFLQKYKWI